jgi:Flp pilus assembly pilin Flp
MTQRETACQQGLHQPDRNRARRVGNLLAGEEGYQLIEYALLVALIIVPLVKVVPYLMDMLRTYFEVVSFTVSLPFP